MKDRRNPTTLTKYERMGKDPFSRLQPSSSLEDLLAQPTPRNSQLWLLTYLDVFVLIVMLVIMLITLNDIHKEKSAAVAKSTAIQPSKASTEKCPSVTTPVALNCPPPAVIEHHPIQPIALEEPKVAELEPKNVNLKAEPVEERKTDPSSATDSQKLQQQLEKAIDEFGLSKAVHIKSTENYAQLEIQDKVLFKSSEAELTASGGMLLKRIAPLLKQSKGFIFIEGHTDNIPIKTAQFPTNWELGASRATNVLRFLVLQQLESSRLRAITYADTMPIVDNSTPEGREKNRRVNILIKFSE